MEGFEEEEIRKMIRAAYRATKEVQQEEQAMREAESLVSGKPPTRLLGIYPPPRWVRILHVFDLLGPLFYLVELTILGLICYRLWR